MDTKTQRRGSADTSSSRFAKLLVVSLLLHVPLTPWAALVGLLRLWSPPADDVESPAITAIPVDLLDEQEPSAPAQPAQPETAPEDPASAAPAAKKPKPAPKATPRDAGAPDADQPDADQPDADQPDAGRTADDAGAKPSSADAGASADAGPADAGPRPISEPALVGNLKQIADPGANVRLWIYADRIRETPLAPRIGPLLRSLYQWRDFFGPTGIDPIRDIDQIMLYGPQLRDTSNIVAVLKHHVPPDRMHTNVDLLVRGDKAGGMWLNDELPAASVHLDGAEHRFILANAQTVIMTNPRQYDMVRKIAKVSRLPASHGPEALIAYVVTPWRVFIGLPIQVPHSIKWVRIRVTPTPDGGASAALEAEDEGPAQASEDATYLTRSVDAVSQLNLGFLGSLLGQQTHKFIEHYSFSANGKMIRGEAQITAEQLSTALDLAGAFLADRSARHERTRAPAVPSAQTP